MVPYLALPSVILDPRVRHIVNKSSPIRALTSVWYASIGDAIQWTMFYIQVVGDLPLFNKYSINETLLSVLYFNTYNCVYTVLVFSGCVVIFKEFY